MRGVVERWWPRPQTRLRAVAGIADDLTGPSTTGRRRFAGRALLKEPERGRRRCFRADPHEECQAQRISSVVTVVIRVVTGISSPTFTRASPGMKIIDECMCGGSAKSRFLPATS